MVDKCDYTRHPNSKKLSPTKASAHIPQWQQTVPKEVVDVAPEVPVKPARKKKQTASNVVPTDKDSIMSKTEN
jgi:type IV secretion system protein VirD4